MTSFNYQTDFQLENESRYSNWLSLVIAEEGFQEGEIDYIFCDDEQLLKLNQDFLKHDTYTDIISFDYSMGMELHGEIYISVERVAENANLFDVDFDNEMSRVMVHGILHYCGYKDKSKEERKLMESKENYYMAKL